MEKKKWELVENEKTKRWFLAIPEGLREEEYPSLNDIREAAVREGVAINTLVSDRSLEKNLQKALAIPGEEFSFPIVIESSFDVRISISPDKTRAMLYIRKATERKHEIDMKLVSSVINASRLKGLDATKLKEAIHSFQQSDAMELEEFVLAEGTPPSRGKNRNLIPKIEWLEEQETNELRARLDSYEHQHPSGNASKSFPVSEATQFCFVEKSQIVYELSPVEPGEPGYDVYGIKIPGLPGNDPFIHVMENIILDKDGLKAERTGILIASGSETDGYKLRIIPYIDGSVTPLISPDDMTVSLILESEEGAGNPLSVEAAFSALEEKGITGDIDSAAIESAIAEVRLSKKSSEIVVLRGQKPVPAGGFRITWFVNFPTEIPAMIISSGDRILEAEKLPAGSDGYDIFGTILKASDAEPETIPEHGEEIAEENHDGKLIFIAETSGEITYVSGKLSISDTKTITGDINDSCGDVHFPGNLTIVGNIENGRTVKTAGSLSVEGNAGVSLLSADTSVMMHGGIKGDGRGIVWAKHGIGLTFAENARIFAGQDISIDNYCFQCTVKTNGTLLMKGNPAILLGGNIRASKGVEVFELGSVKTLRTSISFGQNYLVSDQIEVSEKEVRKIKEAVAKIDTQMQQTSNTNPRIHELRRRKLDLLKRNDKLTVRIFTLKEQFETHILSHIRVESTVYPGVILESHGRYYEVREQRHHVEFIFDQHTGQIICKPIEN